MDLKSLDSARADHAIVSKIVIKTQWHQGNEFDLAILKYLKSIHFFLYFSSKNISLMYIYHFLGKSVNLSKFVIFSQIQILFFSQCLMSSLPLFLPEKTTTTIQDTYTGPRSAVGNVAGYRCVSDCRSRGHEFDPGPVPYFRGD